MLIDTSWPADAPFRWGSITKTATALTALSLADAGALNLNTPVREFIPEGVFSNRWADAHPLTIRQLLDLTAGLPDLSREEWDSNVPRRLGVALKSRERPLLWPPGLQHSYTNTPPGLTAAAIEASTGNSFEQVMRARLLEPLGMTTAGLGPVAGLPGGFKADGTTPLPYWHMTFPAFGALNASVTDMARLLTMLLQAGWHDGKQLFSDASIRSLFAPGSSLGARAGLEVGYGAGMYSWISNGHQFWGHGGDADGYRSRYGLLPGSGRGYLIAINTDRPALLRKIVRRLEHGLSQDLPSSSVRQPATTGDAGLSRLTGTYYPSAARFDVSGWLAGAATTARVRRIEDGLEFVRGKRRTKLIPMGPGQFRRPDDPVVTVVFVSDENGSLFLQGELGNYVNTSLCPGFLPDCHQ